ncbi:hypothetical protein [Pseudonocardia spinosispora]|uniref:hypothetical protein n=1 Tax=Pseudonocardia spinosispora TaxID=103441 RepID=UPI00041FDBCD|nr:hypothetical protein [Pseudonocardia spinosispora]
MSDDDINTEDILGGFVLDTTALDQLAAANIYATTFADRAAVRGIVLVIPTSVLAESWQRAVRTDPDRRDDLHQLLASPMVILDPLDTDTASACGDLMIGLDHEPDVTATHVVLNARERQWPILAADPTRLRTIEPTLAVEQLPGT